MSESRERRRSGAFRLHRAGNPWRCRRGGTLRLSGLHALKVLVKHLFPTRRVDSGGIGDHTVEIEQDGVVLVACDRIFAFGLPRSRSICFAHSVVLPVSTVRR